MSFLLNRMSRLLLWLLCLLSVPARAQTADSPRVRKLSLGAVFCPDYGFRSLDGPDYYDPVIASRNRREVADFRYTTGLSLLYRIDRRWTVEGGLQRADRGYKTVTSYTHVPLPDSPMTVTTYYHYIFLELPLKLDYSVITGRCRLYVTGGITPQYFLSGRSNTIRGYEGAGLRKSSEGLGIRRILTASILAGVGMDYTMSQRLHARIEPVYRSTIKPVPEGALEVFLYATGVNLGLYYKL